MELLQSTFKKVQQILQNNTILQSTVKQST